MIREIGFVDCFEFITIHAETVKIKRETRKVHVLRFFFGRGFAFAGIGAKFVGYIVSPIIFSDKDAPRA